MTDMITLAARERLLAKHRDAGNSPTVRSADVLRRMKHAALCIKSTKRHKAARCGVDK